MPAQDQGEGSGGGSREHAFVGDMRGAFGHLSFAQQHGSPSASLSAPTDLVHLPPSSFSAPAVSWTHTGPSSTAAIDEDTDMQVDNDTTVSSRNVVSDHPLRSTPSTYIDGRGLYYGPSRGRLVPLNTDKAQEGHMIWELFTPLWNESYGSASDYKPTIGNFRHAYLNENSKNYLMVISLRGDAPDCPYLSPYHRSLHFSQTLHELRFDIEKFEIRVTRVQMASLEARGDRKQMAELLVNQSRDELQGEQGVNVYTPKSPASGDDITLTVHHWMEVDRLIVSPHHSVREELAHQNQTKGIDEPSCAAAIDALCFLRGIAVGPVHRQSWVDFLKRVAGIKADRIEYATAIVVEILDKQKKLAGFLQ